MKLTKIPQGGALIPLSIIVATGASCRIAGPPVSQLPDAYSKRHSFSRAAQNNDLPRLHKLKKSGYDINTLGGDGRGTALNVVVAFDDVNATRLLLQFGADANKASPDGTTPLHTASGNGRADIVRILLGYGASVNVHGGYYRRTPLHEAALVAELEDEQFEPMSNREVVQLLLSRGAETNAINVFGQTPLWDAVYNRFHDVTQLLIESGADIDAQNYVDGKTVLHFAAANGDLYAVKLLVSHGADIRAQSFNGDTPLHEAASRGHLGVFEFLVNSGANQDIPNEQGKSPRDVLNKNRPRV